MLEFMSVSAAYPDGRGGLSTPVLRDLSFQLAPGETLGVVGSSGSGKSTLLRLIAGLLKPSSGQITPGSDRPSEVWLSPQTPVLIDFRTALQNALLGREITSKVQMSDVDTATTCLGELGLAQALRKTPSELSGGMRRRVALAQALLSARSLTLLDEPFAELDGLARQIAERALHKRRGDETSIILVTHDLDSVCAVCDRALILAGPPTMVATIVDISPAIVNLRDPAERRRSAAFPDAVAQLQKQVVEAA